MSAATPREKSLKISRQLHKKIMTAKAQTGIPVYELVERAWETFEQHEIKPPNHGHKQQHPFSDVSDEESEYLKSLLAMMRSSRERRAIVKMMIEDWKRKEDHSSS